MENNGIDHATFGGDGGSAPEVKSSTAKTPGKVKIRKGYKKRK